MSWRDEPATSSQLTAIRDFYATAIGWDNAMARVQLMKKSGFTKGQASDEITRLHEEKVYGRWTGPKY